MDHAAQCSDLGGLEKSVERLSGGLTRMWELAQMENTPDGHLFRCKLCGENHEVPNTYPLTGIEVAHSVTS
jgi:hypothetical protein